MRNEIQADQPRRPAYGWAERSLFKGTFVRGLFFALQTLAAREWINTSKVWLDLQIEK